MTFLAPKEVLESFLADLRAQGMEVCEGPLFPGLAVTCRLGVAYPPVRCSLVRPGEIFKMAPWAAFRVEVACDGLAGVWLSERV